MNMKIYIIGTIVNGDETIGYNLMDVNDNFKTMSVKRSSLISAVKSGQIKVENATITQGPHCAVRGKTYSLESLSYEDKKTGKFISKGILMLNLEVGVVAQMSGASVKRLADVEVVRALRNGQIINKEDVEKWITSRNTEANIKRHNVQSGVLADIEPDREITIATFREFMARHNWKYSIEEETVELGGTMYTLSNVSPDCEILHIPVGITTVGNIFSSEPTNLKRLVISKTVTRLGDLFPNQALKMERTNIEEVYIQDREYGIVMEGEGLSNLNITGRVRLPSKKFGGLEGVFCNCYINSINFEDVRIDRVCKSFNKTKFNFPEVVRLRQPHIVESYINTSGIHSVKFCERNVDIEQSFVYSSINKISADDMVSIERSFSWCALREVDFVKCVKLVNLTKAFMNNKNLEKASFNSLFKGTVINVESNEPGVECNFYACPLKQIYIERIGYDSDIHIFNLEKGAEVIIGKDCKKLGAFNIGASRGPSQVKLTLLSDELNLVNIGSTLTAMGVDRIADLGIRDKVVHVKPNAFMFCRELLIDTLSFPNWHILESQTFKNSQVETVIINKNIQIIQDGALENASSLRNVIIDGSGIEHKIKKSTLKQNHSMTRMYIVRGSEIAEQFRKWSNSLAITEVDSVEEAINMIYSEVGKDNVGKYKLLLTGTENEWLANEKYGNNISFLYKLLSEHTKNIPEQELELNTTMFKRLDNTYANKFLQRCIENNKAIIIDSYDEPSYAHNNRFVSLSNLFTSLFDNNEKAYSEVFWTNVEHKIVSVKPQIIHGDVKNDIIMSLDMQLASSGKATLLFIVVGGNIQFISAVNLHDYFLCSFNSKNNRTLELVQYYKYNADICKYSITKYLKRGDCILPNGTDRHCIIGGVDIPFRGEFARKANPWSIIGDTWMVIGFIKGRKSRTEEIVKVLFYDTVAQKLITTAVENNSIDMCRGYSTRDEGFKVGYINQICIEQVYDLQELDQISGEYFLALSKFCYKVPTTTIVDMLAADEQAVKAERADKNNYDIGCNQAICKAADFVYSVLGDNKDRSFPNTKEEMDGLVATGLVRSTQKTLRDIQKKTSGYALDKKHELEGYKNETVYVEYVQRGELLVVEPTIVGTVVKQGEKRFKSTLYESMLWGYRLREVLYEIGEFRAKNKECTIHDRISNIPVKLSDFVMLKIATEFVQHTKNSNENEDTTTKCEVRLAIDKASGNVFIIVNEPDSNIGYTLFRLKDLFGAREAWGTMRSRRMWHNNLGDLMDEIQYNEDGNGSLLSMLRNSILSGVPNGVYAPGVTDTEVGYMLLERMAKQQDND